MTLTDGFWAAVRRRELTRPVCAACGHSFFTPQVACPRCRSEDWSYRPSSGRGRVHSATVVHRAPRPGFPVPYRLAVVELDEGWSMLANLVDGPDGPDGRPEAPAPGTPVELTWIERDGRLLPAFTEVGR